MKRQKGREVKETKGKGGGQRRDGANKGGRGRHHRVRGLREWEVKGRRARGREGSRGKDGVGVTERKGGEGRKN